ncbi:MAG: transporter substrate-binding domain-containing protein [Aquamicrobium sp.]|uniref:transporter substrate-binding domain-containing protein n=1 Tax=Aquamicrobium sp. TaxID=1872579 RepID=UPI00349E549B|nr:transporter substrate-binding domain-containing protein [Aquamicrobium sp.]
MKNLKWGILAVFSAFLAVIGMASNAAAQQESTWDRIQRTGELRFAVFNFPPYFVKDLSTGEWGGGIVEMAKDAAAELKVNFVPVDVGGWGELVLALTTNKVDLAGGMQATPVRATSIDFAGPIYWIEWVTVNNPNFKGGANWSDYNDPSVRVAVQTGSSDQVLLTMNAPKATQSQFKELSQIILAVSSGRADAFTTTVLSSLIAKEKNPGLGTFNSPQPRTSLPGYFGIRSEVDPRFRNYLNWWAEWNNKLGLNDARMRESMLRYSGISEIPDSVSFRE